jgi:hypothetical protein
VICQSLFKRTKIVFFAKKKGPLSINGIFAHF